ncbi:MAG: histidinol dehydrogenase [Mucinivorans sp.]
MIRVYSNPPRQEWDLLTARAMSDRGTAINATVAKIIERVRYSGDEALVELSREIDGVELSDFLVSESEIAAANNKISSELKQAIGKAYDNIQKFHAAQVFTPIEIETTPGVHCSQRAVPIARIGLYIPGGTAPLFSTVLMLGVPAAVAGCPEVVMCSPPDGQGHVAPEILYTASLCGVKHIYKIGGAQAIAAMAYGTQSIAKVDKIFGPGNRYVTAAKQQVGGSVVAIDMPAGPSEVMILADQSADAAFVAADMLSQVEHGADSQAIAVCQDEEFASEIKNHLARQLVALDRVSIAAKALENSKIIVITDRDEVIAFANAYASEHLIISMEEPWDVARQITAAGSVFIGNYTPESAGDYASGTNHTLPTSGWARSMSGVNLDSFTHKITYQTITRQGLAALAPTIITMADGEGLTAHAMAVKQRLK